MLYKHALSGRLVCLGCNGWDHLATTTPSSIVGRCGLNLSTESYLMKSDGSLAQVLSKSLTQPVYRTTSMCPDQKHVDGPVSGIDTYLEYIHLGGKPSNKNARYMQSINLPVFPSETKL